MEPISEGEYLRRMCDAQNKIPGKLTGYDCPICLNRGSTMAVQGSELVMQRCRCMDVRQSMARIEASGLAGLIEQYTFERYEAREPWQREIKGKAQEYVTNPGEGWFFIGGQSGCGKTHICTAITAALIRKRLHARYMLWRDEAVSLKGAINDDSEYARLIRPLKTVQVLYIDDLFKQGINQAPTPADIGLAFEILNYRYNGRGLLTILSSEWTLDEIIRFDEAIGSRIYQRAQGFIFNPRRDSRRNFRLKE